MTIPSLSFEWLEKWSSPYINHFLQPDTIIPDLSNPQSWNRYSYVKNRPVIANDPTGHCDNFWDCIKPDVWALSVNLTFSFPGPEYQNILVESKSPVGDAINPYTYSNDFEVLSLDFVGLPGKEDKTEVFTTSSSSHPDGFVTPQISLSYETMVLWGDIFKKEGVSAYGGDADNISFSAGGGTVGGVFTSSWGGIVGGLNIGFPPASFQSYHSTSSRNPSTQKNYETNKLKLLKDFVTEFGTKVAKHYHIME